MIRVSLWIVALLALLSLGAPVEAMTNDEALARADAYITANRKGNAVVKIPAATPGAEVQVSLRRLDFHWGAGCEGGPLNLEPTAKDLRYQAKVLQNFNTVSTNGSGMWAVNEEQQGQPEFGHLNWLYDWSQANRMHTHLHTELYDLADPDWVRDLKRRAVNDPDARATLQQAIRDRTKYLIANPELNFDDIQIYNESFSEGASGGPETYWNLFGASGIAEFFHNAHLAAKSVGHDPTLYLNDGWVLELTDANYIRDFKNHVKSIQDAGAAQGFNRVIDALGLQFYTTGADADLASRVATNLDSLQQLGLPMLITEFGAYKGTSPEQAAASLDKTMRLLFGHEGVTGMTIWDWVDYHDDEQWAPYAALYQVNPADFADWQITPAGKVWQDRLGIHDWDGNPNNAWTTQLKLPVSPDGTIEFNGYFGDYEITVDGKTYPLQLTKGRENYLLSMLPGDFNLDGVVDAADFTLWQDSKGTTGNALPADGNGDGKVDEADYELWKEQFGETNGAGAEAPNPLPEPSSWIALSLALLLISTRRTAARTRCECGKPVALSPN